jgi:hypothetical protein
MATVLALDPEKAIPPPEGGAVPEDYVPEGFEDQDEFLKDMRYQYKQDLEYDRLNRDSALDDKKFWNGDQWDPQVLEYRKNLPCLTTNILKATTSQLVGDWRSQAPGIKVLPSEDGDIEKADVRGDLIRNIWAQSRADRATDNAFESMSICGDGAFRVAVDYAYENVFDQDIAIKAIDDALSVVWDRFSVDPTGKDATRCFVDDLMDREAFDKLWPDQSPSTLSSSQFNELATNGWYANTASQATMVRVTEYWRIIERSRMIAMFATGQVQDITDLSPQEVVSRYGVPVRTRESMCRYAQMHLVTGHAILEGPTEYKLTRLPIIRMTGRTINISGQRERSGVVREAKDPIRLMNFWDSKAAEWLGYATQAKFIGPADAFDGYEPEWRNSHTNNDPLLRYNPNASAPPQPVAPPQMPVGFMNQSAAMRDAIKNVTGIHDASLGIRSNETSGVAIMARQREGDVTNIVYFDNGNAAVLEAGEVINQLIPQVYDSARTVRALGEDGAAKLIQINQQGGYDLLSGRHDVMLTTGPSYTTKRVEAAQQMGEFFQGAPEMRQGFADLYFRMLDTPYADEFAKRAKKMLPPQLQDDEEGEEGEQVPPQIQAQMQQMGEMLQQLQAENAELKSIDERENRKLEIDAYAKKTDRLKVLKDIPLGPEGMSEAQQIVDESDELDAPGNIEPAMIDALMSQGQPQPGSMPPGQPNNEPSPEYLG